MMPWRRHQVFGDDVFNETGALAWGLEGALEGVEDGAEGRVRDLVRKPANT